MSAVFLPISFVGPEPTESPTPTVAGPRCGVCAVGYTGARNPAELLAVGCEQPSIRRAFTALGLHVARWAHTGAIADRDACDAARLRLERLLGERVATGAAEVAA